MGDIVKTEIIREIKINSRGRLQVVPFKQNFEFIYRSATEIHWDNKENCLYAPEKMKDWSYVDWFKQILNAVRSEYGYILCIVKETNWINVPNDLIDQIKSVGDV